LTFIGEGSLDLIPSGYTSRYRRPPPGEQNFGLDRLDPTHTGSQDVGDTLVFQRLEGLMADHAPIVHNAESADAKAFTHPLDDRDQGGHIGGIARPHLTSNGPSLLVNDSANHHLF
jgi:hypothetical protein